MNSLSVIILSYTLDESIYEMNVDCINSLLSSETWVDDSLNIYLIESNKSCTYEYNARVKKIIPNEVFNFHYFLNIGIEQSNSEFIALCNNDIIFKRNWFTEILNVSEKNKNFMCFSPIDRNYSTMSYEQFPADKDFYIGWDNKCHYAAWCMVWKRKVFDIIGKLDETFNFYSADDDELMTMRKYAIDNVLVPKSEVIHLSQVVTKKVDEKNSPKIIDKEKYPLSEKEIQRGLSWLWDDVRFYEAYFKMQNKWGNERMIRRINRFLDAFPFFRKRIITKLLYTKNVNLLLSKLTGL